MNQEEQLIVFIIVVLIVVALAIGAIALVWDARDGKIIFRRPRLFETGDPHRAKREAAEGAFARRVQRAVDDLDLERLDALEAEILAFFRDLYKSPQYQRSWVKTGITDIARGQRRAEQWSQAIFAVRQPMVAQRELKGIPAEERHRQEREAAYRDLILAVTLRDETRAHQARFRLLAAADAVRSGDARKDYDELTMRVINYLREMAEEQLEADIGRARTDDELRKRWTEFRQDVAKAAGEALIRMEEDHRKREHEQWTKRMEAVNAVRIALVAAQAELRNNPALADVFQQLNLAYELLQQQRPKVELDEETINEMFERVLQRQFQKATGVKVGQ